MFGIKPELAHDVFWDLFRYTKDNQSLKIGQRSEEVFANLPAYIFPVAKEHYQTYLGWSRWFYGGNDFPCLQVVWPDSEATFPWEDGFDDQFEAGQADLTKQGWLASIVS